MTHSQEYLLEVIRGLRQKVFNDALIISEYRKREQKMHKLLAEYDSFVFHSEVKTPDLPAESQMLDTDAPREKPHQLDTLHREPLLSANQAVKLLMVLKDEIGHLCHLVHKERDTTEYCVVGMTAPYQGCLPETVGHEENLSWPNPQRLEQSILCLGEGTLYRYQQIQYFSDLISLLLCRLQGIQYRAQGLKEGISENKRNFHLQCQDWKKDLEAGLRGIQKIQDSEKCPSVRPPLPKLQEYDPSKVAYEGMPTSIQSYSTRASLYSPLTSMDQGSPLNQTLATLKEVLSNLKLHVEMEIEERTRKDAKVYKQLTELIYLNELKSLELNYIRGVYDRSRYFMTKS